MRVDFPAPFTPRRPHCRPPSSCSSGRRRRMRARRRRRGTAACTTRPPPFSCSPTPLREREIKGLRRLAAFLYACSWRALFSDRHMPVHGVQERECMRAWLRRSVPLPAQPALARSCMPRRSLLVRQFVSNLAGRCLSANSSATGDPNRVGSSSLGLVWLQQAGFSWVGLSGVCGSAIENITSPFPPPHRFLLRLARAHVMCA